MNINIFCHIYQYQLINSCLIDPNIVGHYVIWRDEYIGGNLWGKDKIISEETLSVGENIGDIIWVVVGDREYNRLQEVGISQSDIKKLVDVFEVFPQARNLVLAACLASGFHPSVEGSRRKRDDLQVLHGGARGTLCLVV